jgi:hypothetical protein
MSLSACDFALSLKMKERLKEKQFESKEDIQQEVESSTQA